MSSAHRHALPEGTRLEEYRIDRVLGSGGFGITYLAWDENMARPVAIKEYLPSDLAVREQNLSVYAKSTRDEEIYGWGLDRFREEAQTLARFDHPHIVRVLRFLTANNTAYMVMQYVEGETLGDVLKRRGVLGEEELRGFMVPLLNGLEAVHEAGILHRDIKPGNIYVRKDGSPVLLDFGAARQSIQGRTRSMTAVLTPPYAPFEQYGKTQKQGPWTDIYAFSAVLYQAVSGKLPPDAPDRVADEDPFEPTARVARGRYSQDLFGAIDHALKPRGSDRPQSIEQWRNALWPAAKPNPPRPAIPQPSPAHATIGKAVGKSDADPNVEDDDKEPDSKRALVLKLVGAIVALGVTVACGLIGGKIWTDNQYPAVLTQPQVSGAPVAPDNDPAAPTKQRRTPQNMDGQEHLGVAQQSPSNSTVGMGLVEVDPQTQSQPIEPVAAFALTPSAQGLGGAELAAALRVQGIALIAPPDQPVLLMNQSDVSGGGAVAAASGSNVLLQNGGHPCQYTLAFVDRPFASLSFNRSQLKAGPSGITHPVWKATAYDANGGILSSVTEPEIRSFTDVPARRFTLNGPGIGRVTFWGDDKAFDGFCNVVIDTVDVQK